jgi:peptide/nickel transport system substrate-binding protein
MDWKYPIDRRDFLKLAGAASLTLFGAPIWGERNLAEAQEKDVFEEFGTAYSETIVTLHPYNTTAVGNVMLEKFIFDTPIDRDGQTNEMVNRAVKGWEAKSDKVWRYYLRPGMKFWNGNKLTAKSFAFTQNLVIDPKFVSPQRNLYSQVEKAAVVDEYTVDVICKEPYPAYPAVMVSFAILDEQYYSSNSLDHTTANPMGSGPFVFKKWNRGIGIEMEVNKNYWMPPPPIKVLKYYGIQEAETRTASLLSGQTKVIAGVPLDHFERIQKAGFRAEGKPGPRIVFAGFNQRIKPFDDVRVRQACNYAVDNRKIMKVFMKDMGEVMNQPLSSTIFGHNPKLSFYDQDIERAKKLMGDAGYGKGYPQTLNLEVQPGFALSLLEICEALAYDLRKIGLNVKVQPRENADFRQRRPAATGDPNFGPIFAGSWGNPSFDPQNYLPYLLNRKGSYGRNYDEKAEQWIDKCNSIVDKDKRLKELHALESYFHEQCPFIWLHLQPNTYAMSNDHNFKARTDEYLVLSGLKKTK